MIEPFVCKVPHVAYGKIYAFALRALYESRKAVVVFADVDKLPVVVLAHGFEVVYVLGLKGLVVISRITARRELIV